MTIIESINFLKISVEQTKTLLDLFLAGKIDVDDFEDQYTSIMSDIKDVAYSEAETPNDNRSYTLNNGTIIKNKDGRDEPVNDLLVNDPDLYNFDKWEND